MTRFSFESRGLGTSCAASSSQQPKSTDGLCVYRYVATSHKHADTHTHLVVQGREDFGTDPRLELPEGPARVKRLL